jgi:DNA-binding XRE family transcriptional regulator
MAAKRKPRVEWTSGEQGIALADARRRFGRELLERRTARMVRRKGGVDMRPMRRSELARELGVSQTTVGHYEDGRAFPSLPIYIAICRIFNVGKIPLISS